MHQDSTGQPAQKNQNGNNKVILLVEDEAPFRHIYGDAFRGSTGYQIMEAEDGDQALAAVQKQAPDLILLDLILPKMSGFDVLTRLKNDPVYSNIPIIVYTVIDEKDQIDRAMTLGANDYAIKGLTTANEVIEKANKLLQTPDK